MSFFPIHITFVLSWFIFRPDSVPNISKTLSEVCKDLSESSRIREVSSTNYTSLYCVFPIFIPVISGLRPMRMARTSAASINK